jgi:hypothetical protein
MLANRLLTLSIGWIVAGDLDRTTVLEKMEVMGRLFMTKTHGFVAADIHPDKCSAGLGEGVWPSVLGPEKQKMRESNR